MKKRLLSRLLVALLLVTALLANTGIVLASDVDWSFLDWNQLDYGLYWYSLGNQPHKFVAGQSNPAFDPAKPTLIYVHGWQPGTVENKQRESYWYDKVSVDMCDAWINDGWNVGIFYWNQFSDETYVTDAEAKIWTPNGPQGMRFKKADGTYADSGITKSAAELFADQYVEAMTGYTGDKIVIAGHSLGSQMASRTAKLICDKYDAGQIPADLLPRRVSLLDPYFSHFGKDYLNGATVGQTINGYVRNMIDTKNIVFDHYRSSLLTQGTNGDSNEPLEEMCAYSVMYPNFEIDEASKHNAARYTYLWSYYCNPPAEIVSGSPSGKDAASAKTSILCIAQMMGPTYYWSQRAGTYTADPADDTYNRYTDTGAYTAVTSLTLSKSSTTLGVGGYDRVTATVGPKDATNKVVIWSSDNPAIAKAFVNGTIKGVAPGKTTVRATTADGNIVKTVTVTVK